MGPVISCSGKVRLATLKNVTIVKICCLSWLSFSVYRTKAMNTGNAKRNLENPWTAPVGDIRVKEISSPKRAKAIHVWTSGRL